LFSFVDTHVKNWPTLWTTAFFGVEKVEVEHIAPDTARSPVVVLVREQKSVDQSRECTSIGKMTGVIQGELQNFNPGLDDSVTQPIFS
jgi:hypothetical protein